MLHAIILAGGKGERFWPLSRVGNPKQLVDFDGTGTMLDRTVTRLLGLIPKERIWIITSENLVSRIAERFTWIKPSHLIGEPLSRNTAPAIGIASLYVNKEDPDAVTVTLASDHMVADERRFLLTLSVAEELARARESLVLFGAVPTRPETGYGYIELGEEIGGSGTMFRVSSFREKPDLETAKRFIASGKHLWNCSIFVWKTKRILDEISESMPKLSAQLKEFLPHLGKKDRRPFQEFYENAENISIDYGVLEKTKEVIALRGDFGWEDMGSWSAVMRLKSGDLSGNVSYGDCVQVDTKDCFFFSTDGVIAALGVNDLVVVRVKDATLVARKEREQDIKKIVDALKAKKEYENYL
ncbi:MAG: mannose-1-phosphate guanylyltransferase [Candidatus Eisenbacteria bacterium]|nr:mannose-1-phosphate guanylyltransferase [Candidatus Eisenbacteria bacterium]